MTVIKGELNDPAVKEVAVSDGIEMVRDELEGYDDNLGYLDVEGRTVESPVEIDLLDVSVNFQLVPVSNVSHYGYSGRDYSPDLFDGIVMETESMRRAPSVVSKEEGFEVVDGNSYFEAFRERREEEDMWVRVHDYSKEEALDHFLEDHFPGCEADLQERENWYSDQEIERTLDNMYSGSAGLDLQSLDEFYRVRFNDERLS